MTIKDALQMIRTVVPAMERSVFINSEVKDYDHYSLDDPQRLKIVFSIWDERQFYDGPTLEVAVQKCLLGNVPDQGQIHEAEAVFVEVEAMPSVPERDIPY